MPPGLAKLRSLRTYDFVRRSSKSVRLRVLSSRLKIKDVKNCLSNSTCKPRLLQMFCWRETLVLDASEDRQFNQ